MTKLLIVDDNQQSRYLLQVLLTTHGFTVEAATNGAEALEQARRALPDMIISDILMPVMDGFALCRAWREDERLRDIPFVFYTATYTDPQDEDFALRLGAARFIVKPSEPDDFLAMLREVIAIPQTGQDLTGLAPQEDDAVFYKEYNQVLVRKLESKALELKEEYRQAQKAQRFLQEVLQTTPSAVFTVDPDRIITSWNRMAEKITGYSAAEVLGKKCSVIESPTCEEECRLFDDRVEKPGKYRECVITCKDGRKRTTLKNFNLLFGSAGEVMGGVESFIDITDRKQSEEALQESENKYRGLVENAKEGIFQRQSGRFLTVNRAFADILGYECPEEVIETITTNMVAQLFVRPEEHAQLLEVLAARGYVQNFEIELYRKDRSRIWVSISMLVVRDRQGQWLYNQGIFADIMLQKQMEEERRQATDRLRSTLAAAIQALATASEARDPYTSGHQQRVADLARAIAVEIGLSTERIDGLRLASTIHDVGKISVPAEILSMPRKLTDLEFSLVKTHAQKGYEILRDIAFPWPISRMVLEHHEKIDGSGYPQGLTGDKLLLESRIIAVADVVEAMASHRPYRPGLGIDAALEEITVNRGILYDTEIVNVCLKLFRNGGYQLTS